MTWVLRFLLGRFLFVALCSAARHKGYRVLSNADTNISTEQHRYLYALHQRTQVATVTVAESPTGGGS